MYQNLAVSLERADALLNELRAEYDKSLRMRSVSNAAIQLTHDICEKLRGVLDRAARRYWEIHVSPTLAEPERSKAAIYFPIAPDQQGLDSTLGRWQWKSVRQNHQPVYQYLAAQQPFTAQRNQWLTVLNDLAVAGKHIDLVPQKRLEQRQVTVTGPGGGSISWGPGVTFGGGISVMGAPIDPRTQSIVPTPGVTQTVEIWVSFVISGHDVNALSFCETACKETRRIVTEMTNQFAI